MWSVAQILLEIETVWYLSENVK